MWDVLLLYPPFYYYPPFCMICELNKSISKENVKMADIFTGAPVNIKTSIFNLRFLGHLCIDFYATK